MPAVQDEAAAGQATEALVYSVDVKTNQQAVQLRFKGWASDDQAEALAQVGMNAVALRQWLGIFHAQYRLAQWPAHTYHPSRTRSRNKVGAFLFPRMFPRTQNPHFLVRSGGSVYSLLREKLGVRKQPLFSFAFVHLKHLPEGGCLSPGS